MPDLHHKLAVYECELAQEKTKRLQAQHERDCMLEELVKAKEQVEHYRDVIAAIVSNGVVDEGV